MNTALPNTEPDDHWQALLVAAADGTLDDQALAEVEAYLRAHPEAAKDWRALQFTSSRNQSFWQQVQPPQPSEAAWQRVWHNIQQPHQPIYKPGRWSKLWMFGLLLVTCVMVALVWFNSSGAAPADVPPTPQPALPPDQLSEYDTLPMATYDDVMISQYQGSADEGLVLPGRVFEVPLALATLEELELTQSPMQDATLVAPFGIPVLVDTQSR